MKSGAVWSARPRCTPVGRFPAMASLMASTATVDDVDQLTGALAAAVEDLLGH